jgi:acyl carrier protein
MNSREEILAQITRLMVDMFELDAGDIRPEAQLYEDLDIDSIDAVDMVVELRNITGKQVKPEDFKSVRTVSDVVDAVAKLMQD